MSALLVSGLGLPEADASMPAKVVSGPPTVVAAAAAAYHTVVVGDDGLAYGTGMNSSGQLTGVSNQRALRLLRGLPAGVQATAAVAAGSHSLVLGDDGLVYGTGSNGKGQLTGTGRRRTLTVLTGLPSRVRAVAAAAGTYHSLVVGDDGLVYGTGLNLYGQLTGTGGRRTLTVLTGLPAGVRAVAAAAGWSHSLVVGDDGFVYGAGYNDDGQLTGTDHRRRTLTPLTGLPAGVGAVAAAAGPEHSLVLGDDGRVYGTGDNYYGQLTGTGSKDTLTPLTGLPAGVGAVAAAAGSGHSLVVGADDRVYGTGKNDDGQLTGTGRRRTLALLTGLPAGVGAVSAASGGDQSLVVGDDGLVYGTGLNDLWQLTGADTPKRTLTRLVWGIANTVRPRLTGTPRLGQTLTARHGQWWPLPTAYSYRWYRNSYVIKGATGPTHQVVAGDVGTRLRVRVTARHPGYQPKSKYTGETALITRR